MTNGHILFDLDGTLIDSSEGVVIATNYALSQMGVAERPADQIKAFIGYPLETMFASFTDAPIEDLSRHFQVKARETVVASAIELDNSGSVLRELANAGYTLALVTTKISIHIDLIIEKCGWQDLFSAAIGGDDVDRVKPAPDAFLLALRKLSADPKRTLVVGDTENDILAARKIGLATVAVASPYGRGDELKSTRPTYYIEKLSALPQIVRSHFGAGV